MNVTEQCAKHFVYKFLCLSFIFFFAGTRELGGHPIRNEFCPIAGRYHFKYNINDGSEERNECNSFSSDLDNCPDGSVFHLQFKKCSFENHGTVDELFTKRTQNWVAISEHCTLVLGYFFHLFSLFMYKVVFGLFERFCLFIFFFYLKK